ncbi:hypothetical protein IJM86_00200 [bacterium]|nr:hypothetical protein [bacterium]
MTDDSYTSYPNNTFTKEIQPQEIFSCDHAVDSYLITPLSKETKALVHTGAQKKTETTNTTGTITNKTTQKVNTEKTEKTPNNTQKDTTPTVKKEEKSE